MYAFVWTIPWLVPEAYDEYMMSFYLNQTSYYGINQNQTKQSLDFVFKFTIYTFFFRL